MRVSIQSSILCSLSILHFCLLSPALAQPVAKDAASGSLACAIVAAGEKPGEHTRLGVGFFIDDGVLATSYHVVQDMHAFEIIMPGNGKHDYRVCGLYGTDPTHDIALFFVPGAGVPRLLLSEEFVQAGQKVNVLGLPEPGEKNWGPTAKPVYSSATISMPVGFKDEPKGVISVKSQPGQAMLIKCSEPYGISGAPVLNERGHVVGMIVRGGEQECEAISSLYLKSLEDSSSAHVKAMMAQLPEATKKATEYNQNQTAENLKDPNSAPIFIPK